MTPARAQKVARRLRPGDVAEVLWLDSGRNSSHAGAGLVRNRLYGRVHSVTDDALELAVDVAEEPDGGSDTYGTVWIPCILECYRLRRE